MTGFKGVIMKRTILPALLVFGLLFCSVTEKAFGQTNTPSSAPIDLVLLLDTSSNMSSSYEHVNNYITGAFLNEFLRVGDTFHLIAFSQNQRLDLARRIAGVGDIETIIGRMFLQYPVESGSNIGSALSYAEQYIQSLPNRPKKIVLVSIGANDTDSLVSASRQRLGSRNTTLDFVQVTPGQAIRNPPSSGRLAVQRTTTEQQTQQTTRQTTQQTSRDTQTTTQQSTQQTSRDTQTSTQQTTQQTSRDTQATTQQSTQQTTQPSGDTQTVTTQQTTQPPETQERTTAQTQTGDEPSAQETTQSESVTAQPVRPPAGQEHQRSEKEQTAMASLPYIVGGILLLLLILGLIILLSSRRLGSSPNRVMASSSAVPASASPAQKVERFVDHSKDLANFASGSTRRTSPYDDRPSGKGQPVINPSGPLLLNLFVEDQNTAIGRRNIHSLKSGYSLSVGGAKGDDFLVFLVPIPGGIGEIRRNGSSLTFVPRKPKYFPDIGTGEVRDCINKTIRIVSDKNYEMRFRFEMYEDPLVALNRMLMSVRVPG